MTYVITKPDSGPSPKLDAPIIQNNFSQYGTVFSKNHTSLKERNPGDHEAVIIEHQLTDPGVTQNLDVLYNFNLPYFSGSSPQLCVQIPKFLPSSADPTNAKNQRMQLTQRQVNTTGPNQYQSFLAGNYYVYFGSTNSIASNIVLSPVPTNIVLANATPSGRDGSGVPLTVSTTIINNASFKINSNGGGTFYWWALAIP
jgi:hypothetical protein